MANSRVFLSDLKSGRCSSTLKVRLLRFWEARNVRRGGEFMWIDMIMVDVNSTGTSFVCGRCNNSHAVGSLRYRVEMAIADDTAEGVFVCFDGVMTTLHGLKANEAGVMLAEDGVNPEDSQMPPFITDMEGKTYTFQVRVTAYNFTTNHQTFTITRILGGRDPVPVPAFDNNGGDNDDGNGSPGGIPVPATIEGVGGSCETSVNTDTGIACAASRKTAAAAIKMVKKARMA